MRSGARNGENRASSLVLSGFWIGARGRLFHFGHGYTILEYFAEIILFRYKIGCYVPQLALSYRPSPERTVTPRLSGKQTSPAGGFSGAGLPAHNETGKIKKGLRPLPDETPLQNLKQILTTLHNGTPIFSHVRIALLSCLHKSRNK